MGANNNKPVWFNKEIVKEYEELREAGITSQPFRDFVRSAFYNAFDRLKAFGENKKEVDLNEHTGDND